MKQLVNIYILLLPTVHIAQPAFYRRLVQPLPVDRTVVIPEGVTDRHQRLSEPLDHSKLAQQMGLEVQDNQMFVAKRNTALCDVDVNDFSSSTIAYLRTCASVSMQQPALAASVTERCVWYSATARRQAHGCKRD